MEVRVASIKQAREDLKNNDVLNTKIIIATSYDSNIDSISNENKLVLCFDDIVVKNESSINNKIAKKISSFVSNIDFSKEKLYVCCDSGVSRSSAIAAAILRKYKENDNVIWKDYRYQPNVLVYTTLCDEFNLKNFKFMLKYKEYMNKRALKKKISDSRKA